MVMYDMIRNPDVSADDIIQRQYLIGGIDLTTLKGDKWDDKQIARRLELLTWELFLT